jgi:hypothetical protein
LAGFCVLHVRLGESGTPSLTYYHQSPHVRGHEPLLSGAMADLEEDFGADTSRFQAFVHRTDDPPPKAWTMSAPASKIGLLAGIIVALVIVVAIIAWALA